MTLDVSRLSLTTFTYIISMTKIITLELILLSLADEGSFAMLV